MQRNYVQLGDVRELFQAMPDKCVDIVIGSPPYAEKGERYGGSKPWPTDEWIAWMEQVTVDALRVAKNVVIWIVNGSVRKGRYMAACEGLVYLMYRRGYVCERPVIWHKNAPPNRKDWFGNDWEYCLAFRPNNSTRYFDGKAIGTAPKYSAGGRFRQRTKSGARRLGSEYPKGQTTRPRDVFRVLRSLNTIDILMHYAISKRADSDTLLRDLRQAIDAKDLLKWWTGIVSGILYEAVLQSPVQGSVPEVAERAEIGRPSAPRKKDSTPQNRESVVCEMWPDESIGSSPQRRRRNKQRSDQHRSAMPVVSPEGTQDADVLSAGMHAAFLRSGLLLDALPEIQKVRDAVDEVLGQGQTKTVSDLIRATVGGGHLGSKLAFLNEAPFPEKIVEPFIKACCPPHGIVLDPFCGSGTTLAVAEKLERAWIGFECRQEMVDLSMQRVAETRDLLKAAAVG